jgi:hypothetical protein
MFEEPEDQRANLGLQLLPFADLKVGGSRVPWIL